MTKLSKFYINLSSRPKPKLIIKEPKVFSDFWITVASDWCERRHTVQQLS